MITDMVAYQKEWYESHKDELAKKRLSDKTAKNEYARQYRLNNKEKVAVSQKRYAEEHAEERKAYMKTYGRLYHIKKNYGLSIEEYDNMIENGCVVCGAKEDLQVDHDHKCCPGDKKTCGKCVRGILCGKHNRALGCVNDNVEELRALADYLLQCKDVLGEAI